ncbi:cytidine deaminase [Raineyella fluvialis]|uniref:Cytidine deaminase n=1 Tax=Raineyella fluvialis TaxID=2662261 RepID=A0A5Q2FKZ0_9ACTN|nr:cytidine deaminase [Raineyella fluvialis]
MIAVDWAGLRRSAVDACERAYAPYSRFPVGAAALVDDGRVVAGCNVENSSYGVTLCAECGLVSSLVLGGGGRLVAFVCVDGAGTFLMPCGRCRQLLAEHADPGMLVQSGDGPIPLTELLPRAFGSADLDRIATARKAGSVSPGRAGERPAPATAERQADERQADWRQGGGRRSSTCAAACRCPPPSLRSAGA